MELNNVRIKGQKHTEKRIDQMPFIMTGSEIIYVDDSELGVCRVIVTFIIGQIPPENSKGYLKYKYHVDAVHTGMHGSEKVSEAFIKRNEQALNDVPNDIIKHFMEEEPMDHHETIDEKEAPEDEPIQCPNCEAFAGKPDGGFSGDVRTKGGMIGLDVDFYRCRVCGAQWSD